MHAEFGKGSESKCRVDYHGLGSPERHRGRAQEPIENASEEASVLNQTRFSGSYQTSIRLDGVLGSFLAANNI